MVPVTAATYTRTATLDTVAATENTCATCISYAVAGLPGLMQSARNNVWKTRHQRPSIECNSNVRDVILLTLVWGPAKRSNVLMPVVRMRVRDVSFRGY